MITRLAFAWAEELYGDALLRGGREYAAETARCLDPSRLGAARNPDLVEFLLDIEQFLDSMPG